MYLFNCRLYHANDGRITINLNATICGDFTVTLYHARNALKGMGRPQGIKICQFQMHTGFIAPQETLIHLDKTELDELPDVEHVPMNFNVSIPIQVHDVDRPPASNPPWIPARAPRTPLTLFGSQLEYEENVDNFSEYILTILIAALCLTNPNHSIIVQSQSRQMLIQQIIPMYRRDQRILLRVQRRRRDQSHPCTTAMATMVSIRAFQMLCVDRLQQQQLTS